MKQKFKFILYIQDFGYVKHCLSDVFNKDNLVIFEFGWIQKKLSTLSKYANEYFFKRSYFKILRIFYLFFIKKSLVMQDETPVFFFYEYNYLSCDKSFILYLKSKYPNCRIILYLTNTIENGNIQVLDTLKKNKEIYDLIITYNQNDAVKYNLNYHQWFYSKLETQEIDKEYGLLFVGGDKGRIELLRRIADECDSNGIKYKIAVQSNENKEKYYGSGVEILNEPLTYSDYLNLIHKSNCILELVPNGIMACTLRTAEAIATQTKLLTNNLSLLENSIYNSNQMYIFNTIEDIDFEYIKRFTDKRLFHDSDILSPIYFFNFIEEKLQINDIS